MVRFQIQILLGLIVCIPSFGYEVDRYIPAGDQPLAVFNQLDAHLESAAATISDVGTTTLSGVRAAQALTQSEVAQLAEEKRVEEAAQVITRGPAIESVGTVIGEQGENIPFSTISSATGEASPASLNDNPFVSAGGMSLGNGSELYKAMKPFEGLTNIPLAQVVPPSKGGYVAPGGSVKDKDPDQIPLGEKGAGTSFGEINSDRTLEGSGKSAAQDRKDQLSKELQAIEDKAKENAEKDAEKEKEKEEKKAKLEKGIAEIRNLSPEYKLSDYVKVRDLLAQDPKLMNGFNLVEDDLFNTNARDIFKAQADQDKVENGPKKAYRDYLDKLEDLKPPQFPANVLEPKNRILDNH